MKVVLETTPVLPKPSGVGLYVLNLLATLSGLQVSEGFELGITYQPSFKNWLLGRVTVPEAVQYYGHGTLTPLPVRLVNLLATLPQRPFLESIEERFGKPDVYHGTNFAVYPCRHSLRVMTIYDVTFLKYPQYVTAIVRTYAQRVKQCLRWTDLVVTISESTKQDIVEYLGVPPGRVWVTPLASRYAADSWGRSGRSFSQPPELATLGDSGTDTRSESVPERSANRPFILFVSTLEPRKNVVRLIAAFNQLKADRQIDHQLVLVGQKGWQYQPIFAAIAASPWRHHIRHLDYLSDAEVAYCYAQADVFAYPSLYEGFGLPVLEAMTLGCPVVTANTSSLPEVAGNAALLVDPLREDELAEALWRVIDDRALRQSLIDQGHRQAAEFSWTRTAQATLSAYRSLL